MVIELFQVTSTQRIYHINKLSIDDVWLLLNMFDGAFENINGTYYYVI